MLDVECSVRILHTKWGEPIMLQLFICLSRHHNFVITTEDWTKRLNK